MKYLEKTFSVGMPGQSPMACELCVFGSGRHMEGCPVLERRRRLIKLFKLASESGLFFVAPADMDILNWDAALPVPMPPAEERV